MSIRKTNPFISIANSYVVDSPEPSNISYFWNFGSLLGACLVIQLATGIFLAMHYSSNLDLAFASVQHIMIDVQNGWLIRYAHANGAGFFFIFVYLHMARGIYYGSYRKPRIALWTIGVIIFLLMIITAFLGYNNNSLKSISINNKFFYNKNKNKNKLNQIQIRSYSTTNQGLKYIKSQTDLTNPNDILNKLGITIEVWWNNIHNINVREQIIKEVKNKAGIYIIYNKITGNFYIGSASINKLYTKFSNHLLNFNGNKWIEKAVKKYGLNNLSYGIIEYIDIPSYPNISIKDKKKLLNIETTYISLLIPKYNILTEAIGNKEEMIIKIPFNNERHKLLRQFQMNHNWSEKEYKNQTIIYLYDLNNKYICEFSTINKIANFICCNSKTIKRALNLGHIYIPNIFIKHLNNTNIQQYNNVKEIKSINIKNISGLVKNNLNTKFIITRTKI